MLSQQLRTNKLESSLGGLESTQIGQYKKIRKQNSSVFYKKGQEII